MEHSFIDRYSALDSPVHRLDPRAKLLLLFVFVVIVVSTPPWHLLAFVVYAGLLGWTLALARLPLSYVLLRAAAVLPFSALAALWVPFLNHGPSLVLPLGLHLSIPGLWLFAGVVMKSLLGVSALILLVSTTPFDSLLAALASLRFPRIFVDLLSLTYRYLFLLVGEAHRLHRAAVARGYRPRWLAHAVLIGHLVGHLFVRTFSRAERIYAAMLLRGYSGSMPPSRPLVFRTPDALVLLILLPNLILVRIFLQ